jgi:hypothetical protein
MKHPESKSYESYVGLSEDKSCHIIIEKDAKVSQADPSKKVPSFFLASMWDNDPLLKCLLFKKGQKQTDTSQEPKKRPVTFLMTKENWNECSERYIFMGDLINAILEIYFKKNPRPILDETLFENEEPKNDPKSN